ncbi:amidohydrolase [Microbulbifer agarilyticus]|uniref:amidohydrolase family protein n=1 Tax=Microbulbifer agarilyticus TaxID=260552 RepID=UPI001C977CE0|nr:amidohydrolase family protein [Microbulbifer agarilyticus]MBY6213093.1 amidohydrolase [Microbulbifer agarilyticus]
MAEHLYTGIISGVQVEFWYQLNYPLIVITAVVSAHKNTTTGDNMKILKNAQIFRIFSLILAFLAINALAEERQPVIDMHLHAGPGSESSRYYKASEGETPDEARMRTLLQDMKDSNVVYGVIGGPESHIEHFRQASHVPLIAGVILPCIEGRSPNFFACYENDANWPDIDKLQSAIDQGQIGAIGELYNVYTGISPLDSKMLPYLQLAADNDLIVAVHADRGPPPQSPVRAAGCCPDFNGDHGNPALWSPIMEKHPKLRLVLYHAFRPEFVEAAIALMDTYPNVVVETSPMTRVPSEWVYAALRAYIEAGHGDRIVFGSDYLGSIGGSVTVIEKADFLSQQQKRDILYHNAARFLNLSPQEIAKHHDG